MRGVGRHETQEREAWDISLELVTKHCERLEASLAVLHEHV